MPNGPSRSRMRASATRLPYDYAPPCRSIPAAIVDRGFRARLALGLYEDAAPVLKVDVQVVSIEHHHIIAS